MNLICIIQARSGSTRYPEKIFAELHGKTILKHVVDRCRSVLPDVVVATTAKDYKVIDFCDRLNIPCYAYSGPENDVLARYYYCALTYRAQYVLRVTSDCPAIDVNWLFRVPQESIARRVQFASNCFPPRNIIDGDDCEFMAFEALEWLHQNVTDKAYREHVTKWVYDNVGEFTKLFTAHSYTPGIDLSHLKTSIDTKEDLQWVEKAIVTV